MNVLPLSCHIDEAAEESKYTEFQFRNIQKGQEYKVVLCIMKRHIYFGTK